MRHPRRSPDRRRLQVGVAFLCACLLAPGHAAADDPSAGTRALGAGAAIVPGFGAGAWVVGKKRTAGKLAIASGTSLLGTVGVVIALALTGASRRTVGPLAGAAVLGTGVFVTSTLADLYAILAPEDGTGTPLRGAPWIETALGVYALHDPVFEPGYLAVQRVDARIAAFRGSVQAESAPEIASRRLRAEAAYRVHGPVPFARARDGSYVDLEGALTDHAYARNGFGATVVEASVRGRLDLARVDDGLRGSFVEGQLGTAFLVDRYRAAPSSDVGSLLVAGFAFGTYIGQPLPGRVNGEAKLFYEHRRDGFVGGLQPDGIPAGFLGSFGAQTRLWFGQTWGVGANVQAGSAILGGASLLFRSGAR